MRLVTPSFAGDSAAQAEADVFTALVGLCRALGGFVVIVTEGPPVTVGTNTRNRAGAVFGRLGLCINTSRLVLV